MQTLSVVRRPKAVVFQVRRYRKGGLKAHNKFFTPLVKCVDGTEECYTLRVLFCHEGSAYSGHYTTYVRDDIKKDWVCFNDAHKGRVQEVDPRKVVGGLYYLAELATPVPAPEPLQPELPQPSTVTVDLPTSSQPSEQIPAANADPNVDTVAEHNVDTVAERNVDTVAERNVDTVAELQPSVLVDSLESVQQSSAPDDVRVEISPKSYNLRSRVSRSKSADT